MFRAARLLPLIAFAATFGVFFVGKNREARTVLQSGRGSLIVVAMIVGYFALSSMVRRVVRVRSITAVVMAAAVVAAAAWTVGPYYVRTTANRTVISEPARLPSAQGTSVTVPGATTTTPAPTATVVSAGLIHGIDHTASGFASIVRSSGGARVVRLNKFAISGAPDPVVYLVPGVDTRARGGFKLARLPGTHGDQLDIPLPDSVPDDAGVGWTVLIWCERFAVPIANAGQLDPRGVQQGDA